MSVSFQPHIYASQPPIAAIDRSLADLVQANQDLIGEIDEALDGPLGEGEPCWRRFATLLVERFPEIGRSGWYSAHYSRCGSGSEFFGIFLECGFATTRNFVATLAGCSETFRPLCEKLCKAAGSPEFIKEHSCLVSPQ